MWNGGVEEGKNTVAVLNMVLISVRWIAFKYKINKRSEKKKFKYFKNTKQQRNLQAIHQLSTN